MAYSSTNPVNLVSQGIVGGKIWNYLTTEGSTPVMAVSYFADGVARGMRVNDLVIVRGNSGASGTTPTFSLGIVSSVSSTGGASLALLSNLISTA